MPDGPGPETIGPYRLAGALGAGGMGTVWRAWDERLRRHVAIKQVLAEAPARMRGRLRREARAAARLSHPYIVHIYDLIERDDGDWIVMELVEGSTLRQLLDESGPLRVPQLLQLGREIAEGLAAAHDQGILHRDLKSGNVMVTSAGHAKILDFGLAKELANAAEPLDDELSLSIPGMVIGTSHAMSPEQAQGLPLDARSDLFSLGSLLYEALSGEAPFRGQTLWESLARVMSLAPQPLAERRPDVPHALSDFIARLLAKAPENRPRDAREVAAAFTALALATSLASSSDAAAPLPLPPPAVPAAPSLSGGSSDRWGSSDLTRAPGERGLATPPEMRRLAGERRRICVVCCGLVGVQISTGDSRPLDVEALSEAMAAFHGLAQPIAEELGGSLGASLGNLLCLYFGYPQFFEDNALRAVRSARLLAERAERIALPPGAAGRQRVGVRIALHAGLAVIEARPGQEEKLQLGSTLDVVMALQAHAPSREILATDAGRRLLLRHFALETLPAVALAGGEPVAVFRVLDATDQREESIPRVPLVGRERELGLLLDRLALAALGTGQAVMVSGEAGIGKSRLLQGLKEGTTGQALTWLVGYGSPHTQSSPLAPIVDLLEHALFGPAKESADRRLAQLEDHLRRLGFPLAEAVPLLASLLALPADGRFPALQLPPQEERDRTLETVVSLLAAMAESRPLVLVIEDLHWFDPSSLELLDLLLGEIASLPLLLVATYRPDFQAAWRHPGRITQITLSRLSDGEAEALIERVTGGRPLTPALRRQISERTDGVPLFIEELTKAVLEAEGSGEPAEIPSTLDGSLMARLDHLGEAKLVAQLAAVIGRVFSYDLLAAVADLDEATLRAGLDKLLQAELLLRRDRRDRRTAGSSRYAFKHALIQDTAYLSLLNSHRQEIHRRIARRLEAQLDDSHEIETEILAHHFEKAGLAAEATGFLRQAAGRALQRSAFDEALHHCRKGIELAATLPRERPALELELDLRTAMGIALMPLQGYVSPEVRDNAEQCQALCRELGDAARRVGSLHQLWTYHVLRREREPSLRLAEEIRALADPDDSVHSFIVHSVEATILFYVGDFPHSKQLLAEATAIFQPELYPELAHRFGDHCITAFFYQSWCLWACGEPEAAVRAAHEAMRAARNTHSKHLLATGLSFAMVLWRELREPEKAYETAEQLATVCHDNRFPFYMALAHCGLGWALGHRGEAERGCEVVRQAHARLPGEYVLTYLLELLLDLGRIEEGLAAVEKGLATDPALQLDRFYRAEIHRLHGELLARAGETAKATAELQRALALAHEQGARFFALRAAMGLTRLGHPDGRPALERIYGAFQEGFETLDLRDARALLVAAGDAPLPPL